MALARIRGSGDLDHSFSKDGRAVVRFHNAGAQQSAAGIVRVKRNLIVDCTVGGRTRRGKFARARYDDTAGSIGDSASGSGSL
jgi:hypothetical protein